MIFLFWEAAARLGYDCWLIADRIGLEERSHALNVLPAPNPDHAVPPLPDIWLDALNPKQATVGFGRFQVNQTGERQPLVLEGDVYPRGLGVHAASEVSYNLQPSYRRFVGRAGAEERASWRASVVAKVYFDDVLVGESPLLRAGDPPWSFDIKIQRGEGETGPPLEMILLSRLLGAISAISLLGLRHAF